MSCLGGTILGIRGRNYAALVTDRYLDQHGAHLPSDYRRVFSITKHIFYGIVGDAADVSSIQIAINSHKDLELIDDHPDRLTPDKFSMIMAECMNQCTSEFSSNNVYAVVCGVDPKTHKPFISSIDSTGKNDRAKKYCFIGKRKVFFEKHRHLLFKLSKLNTEDLIKRIPEAMLTDADGNYIKGSAATIHTIQNKRIKTCTYRHEPRGLIQHYFMDGSHNNLKVITKLIECKISE